jgi:3-hydroxybutyryl-CoA dehydratase
VNAAAPSQRFAEDFVVGETFESPPRVLDDEAFALFARLTGDAHPIHYDEAYAAKTRFGRRLTHGLLLMAVTALGATEMSMRLEDSMVAFAEQGCRFIAPVFVGETVTTRFEVASIERKPGRDVALVRLDVSLVTEAGDIVLRGHHAYLLRCRPVLSATA